MRRGARLERSRQGAVGRWQDSGNDRSFLPTADRRLPTAVDATADRRLPTADRLSRRPPSAVRGPLTRAGDSQWRPR